MRITERDIQAHLINTWAHPGKHAYGVPRGGTEIVARLQALGLATAVFRPEAADVIVDDLVDSGATAKRYMELYPDTPFWTCYTKEDKEEWIEFPWSTKQASGEDIATRMLQYIGEDTTRQGLQDTPARIVKVWKEIFLERGKQAPKVTVFPVEDENGLVVDTGAYSSFCEHHVLPFYGQYYFGYIPDKQMVGLSKIARIVNYFSARLQVQEKLGKQIGEYFIEHLSPKGVIVVMKGVHTCKTMRGVNKEGMMTTSFLSGVFKQPEVRQEFFDLLSIK